MTIERNQVYKMDCIKGLQEMLQGGGAGRLHYYRPALPYKLQIQPQA